MRWPAVRDCGQMSWCSRWPKELAWALLWCRNKESCLIQCCGSTLIQIRIQNFKWILFRVLKTKKLRKNLAEFFIYINNCNLHIPRPPKGFPKHRRSLQPSKEKIQHLQKWNLLPFFNFCGLFLPFWIRIRIAIPDSGTPLYPDPDSRDWFLSSFWQDFVLLEKLWYTN